MERASQNVSAEPENKGSDMLELCPNQGEVESLMISEAATLSDPLRATGQPETTDASVTKSLAKQLEETEIEEAAISSELGNVGTEWVSSLAKSQLEILELEMRARAIRSLMKAQGIPVSEDEAEARLVSEDENTPEVVSSEFVEEVAEGNTPSGYESDPVEEVVTPELRFTGEDDDEDEDEVEVMVEEVAEAETTSPEGSEAFDDVQPNSDEQPAVDLTESSEQPDELVEDREAVSPQLNLEGEIREIVDMIVLKVVSERVEADRKQERRDKRNIRRKCSKIVESDIEEGQILDDSDNNSD